jgi:hypothetical protein
MLPLEGRTLSGCCCHGGVAQLSSRPSTASGPSAGLTAPTSCRSSTISRSRSVWEIAAGALSLGVWVLMPKCPVCLAAYVALWTGLGLSFGAATSIRWSLLALSGVLLMYLAVRRVSRLRRLARH